MNLQDAVYELLGIPLEEQPADCYRLLGIARFEANIEVISNAAARQMLYVRQIATGPHSEVSQDLLDLLAEAKRKLLNPDLRRQYDAKLRGGGAEPAIEDDTTGVYSAVSQSSVLIGEPASQTGMVVRDAAVDQAPASDAGAPVYSAMPARRVVAPFVSNGSVAPADSHAGAAAAAPSRGSNRRPSASSRQWVVGAGSDCDIVVRCAYVSRRHCRVWEQEGQYWVEDLGSRNGTHVNHQRLAGAQLISEKDLVTLGTLARMPWPCEAPLNGQHKRIVRIVRIGRSASNDVVLSDTSVSRRHAQISLYADHTMLEDLGSTNGTYVGDSGLPVNRQRVDATDVVRIGRFSMPVSHLLKAESVA